MKVKDAKVGMSAIFTNKSNGELRYYHIPCPKNGTIGEITAIDNDGRPLYFKFEGGSTYCMCCELDPYIEPAKDNDFQATFVHGNKTIVYLSGKRKGASNCSPSDIFDPVKGFALAYMRALGQTVDDIRIEINPAKTEDTAQQSAPQEDKPLTFEVGETVKFRDDLIDGKKYDGITYFDLIKSQLPETFALPKFNAVRDCHLGRWYFPLCVLEKVSQPANLEVFIGGVKYVREAE
jgi:hypothetical protein